jgi:hypothetical protein
LINDELKRILKDETVTQSRYNPVNYLEGGKPRKRCLDSRCPGRDLKRRPRAFELTTSPLGQHFQCFIVDQYNLISEIVRKANQRFTDG